MIAEVVRRLVFKALCEIVATFLESSTCACICRNGLAHARSRGKIELLTMHGRQHKVNIAQSIRKPFYCFERPSSTEYPLIRVQ